MHANPGRSRWPRIAIAEHPLQQIRLQRLHACRCTLGRHADRRTRRPPRHKRGRRCGIRPRHVGALLRRSRQIVRAAAGVGHLPSVPGSHLVRVDLLMCRYIVSLGVSRGHSSAARSARNHAINRHRPRRPNDSAIGTQRQHQRLGSSIDRDCRPPRLEVDRVVLLIRRQKRAVHQHAAVDKVQAPIPRTLVRTRHIRSCRGLLRHRRPHHRRQHRPKRPQQRVSRTSRRQPSRTDAPPYRPLLRILRRRNLRQTPRRPPCARAALAAALGCGFAFATAAA